MKFTVRDLVYIAIFGAIWGALEMTLGSYLHVIFPPLADTFLVGLIMAALGIVVALIGRLFVPKTGSVLMIGIVTAILKMLSIGGVKIGPIAAILIESLLMELVLFLARGPTRWGFVLAGSLAVSWNFFHRFFYLCRFLLFLGFLYFLRFFNWFNFLCRFYFCKLLLSFLSANLVNKIRYFLFKKVKHVPPSDVVIR